MGRKGKSGAPKAARWHKPVAGILLAGASLVSILALASYRPRGAAANWAGPVGHGVAGLLLEAAGIGGYAMAALLLAIAAALIFGKPRVSFARAGSWLTFSLCGMGLLDLLAHARLQGHPAGGVVGSAIADAARAALSIPGAAVLLCAVAGAALVVATDLWALHAAQGAARLGVAGGSFAVRGAAAAIAKARTVSFGDAEILAGEDARIIEPPRQKIALDLAAAAGEEPPQDPREPVSGEDRRRKKELFATAAGAFQSKPPVVAAPADSAEAVAEKSPPPRIVEPKAPPKPHALIDPKPAEPVGSFTMSPGHSAFIPPPISILTGEASQAVPLDREGLTATAEKLRQKLASFGIQGQVTQIRPGPVVTMFEFLPAAGIKVSRIAGLADDLAMAMEALRVRIVAPIPGKGVVGIEVPNKQRETVVLRELVEQDAFQKSHSRLAMCLGKDIEGMPYVADLAKMPHLLIAGTTGSGKSVAVNSMLVSMLLRATPEEVRFLMVDPKMLELSVYEGIPHLLLPVVTDAKKAAMALRWAVEEMERRYQLLAECGVRNIAGFNKKVEKEGDGARRSHKAPREKRVIDLTAAPAQAGESPAAAPAEAAAPAHTQGDVEPLRKLPYLVIIIDELADLMMVASREVETYIARLAQMARAAGIHLMVATQRPSTDVVTGVIKANFPARISFQVASRHDSATIINAPGAENLLGMGDMLIVPPGTSTLTRVHGPYVDEKEIHAVVEHWKAQGAPVYDPNILRPRAEDGDGLPLEDEGPDELYDQAIAAVSDMRFISISLLQRKLRVGYNRAARMIERMEREGIVGPADGAKPREVLIRPLGEMPGAGA
jgi:S-DNA-T family DNA segregation ATPase FtsK/SpoIIIE